MLPFAHDISRTNTSKSSQHQRGSNKIAWQAVQHSLDSSLTRLGNSYMYTCMCVCMCVCVCVCVCVGGGGAKREAQGQILDMLQT